MKTDKYEKGVLDAHNTLRNTDEGGLVSYVVVGQDKCINSLEQACFINLRRSTNMHHPRFVVVQTQSPLESQPYLDWLLGESMFSDYFLEGSYDEAKFVGSVTVRCDIPANLMMCALLLFRLSWEYSNIIEAWTALVEEGLDKSYALVACHFMGGGNITPNPSGATNHLVFNVDDISIRALQQVKSGVVGHLEDNYSVSKGFMGIQRTWDKGELGYRLREVLYKEMHSKQEVISTAFGQVEVTKTENGYSQMVRIINKITGDL